VCKKRDEGFEAEAGVSESDRTANMQRGKMQRGEKRGEMQRGGKELRCKEAKKERTAREGLRCKEAKKKGYEPEIRRLLERATSPHVS
jgi:hypothetical protein